MDVEALFPLSGKVVSGEPRSLVIVIAIYLAVCAVVKVLDFLLGWVPLVGAVLGMLIWLIGLYCAVGIIFGVLLYFRRDA